MTVLMIRSFPAVRFPVVSMNTYTWAEIKKHNTTKDLWVVIGTKVYDLTNFVDEHPGGESVLLTEAGKDGTEAFSEVGHSAEALKEQEKYYIGNLQDKQQ